ncbi:UNVERIFIED_ORG: DNA-binding transcriptional LysR family regulator [Pseudomonas reinekei]|nr:DNA-binding transcriptional LysR family regulator [Pseudomonas reinekei]
MAHIIADSADVGIRLGESLDEHMVVLPITPRIEMAVVGSPGYFKRHGVPQSPADLIQHNCLAYRFTSSGALDRWSFTAPDAEEHTQVFEPRGSAVFNDDESMLRAAIQGVGLIKYLDICLREQLESGELVRVLQSWCSSISL